MIAAKAASPARRDGAPQPTRRPCGHRQVTPFQPGALAPHRGLRYFIYVSLNIYAKRKASPEARQRERLAADVMDELTAWGPREWVRAVKSWHRGPLGAITLVHLNVIAELQMRGPMSMSHLAEALGVSVASATGIIGRMEDRRLVDRRRTDDDRRVVMVHPTAKGAGIFRAIEVRRRSRLEKLLDQLTDEELTGFVIGLRALRQARSTMMASEAAGRPATAGERPPTDEPVTAADPAAAFSAVDSARF